MDCLWFLRNLRKFDQKSFFSFHGILYIYRMARYRVRFNLSKGVNYMRWKVTHPDGEVEYLDPNKVRLTLKNCHLKNNPETAAKILAGANKTVCAWILCDDVIVKEAPDRLSRFRKSIGLISKTGRYLEEWKRLRYNPRVAPNWMFRECNVDFAKFNRIESRGDRLYVIY
jgi:hypothetical protein